MRPVIWRKPSEVFVVGIIAIGLVFIALVMFTVFGDWREVGKTGPENFSDFDPSAYEEVLAQLRLQMQLKSSLDSEDCFNNQAALARLLTDWQPLQPQGPTTMELNAWVQATIDNSRQLAECGTWRELEGD